MRNVFSRPGSASCITITYRKEIQRDDTHNVDIADSELLIDEDLIEDEE